MSTDAVPVISVDDLPADDLHADKLSADEPASARRLRFREAVSGLVTRAEAADLLRWVLLPGAVLLTLGFILMVLGWVGAARTFREIEQIPYLISGGLIGLGLVFIGGLLLASAFWMVLLRKFQEEAEARARAHTEALETRLAQLTPSDESAPRRPGRPRRPTARAR